jgi:Zn-dependent protease
MNIISRVLGWKLPAGSIQGIPLYFHSSWVLFFGTLFLLMWIPATMALGISEATIKSLSVFSIIIIAFSSVILHEYGHALTAKRLGYKCKDITMYPIGGLASIQGEWSEHWKHEFLITLMGPMVNVVIALIAAPFAIWLFPSKITLQILEINCILLGFNLLPFHPMDGGRLMGSLLSGFMGDPLKAAVLTRKLTVAFLFIGLPIIALTWGVYPALIILLVAGVMGKQESRMVKSALVAKQSKSGGQLDAHAEEWKAMLKADAEKTFPHSEELQKHYFDRTSENFEKFQEWMGRVYLILASRSSGPEEVREKAAKVMECLKTLEEGERMAFNTLYVELGEDEDDPGFKTFLTERFLERHQLI